MQAVSGDGAEPSDFRFEQSARIAVEILDVGVILVNGEVFRRGASERDISSKPHEETRREKKPFRASSCGVVEDIFIISERRM